MKVKQTVRAPLFDPDVDAPKLEPILEDDEHELEAIGPEAINEDIWKKQHDFATFPDLDCQA